MRDDVADGLRSTLTKLPLGTTAGSATQHAGRNLTPDEVRESLKAHDTAIDRLITDAVHRRRDVQWTVEVSTSLQKRVAVLETAGPELPPDLEPEGWLDWARRAAWLLAAGGALAWLAMLTGAVAFLLFR